jgi:NAD(P)-dependent dehydrogenase (short-subunit alcohol dehydrogenase family)
VEYRVTGLLEGKVAVVTGAASGIGRAIVECFAAQGACVVGGDIDDERGREVAAATGSSVRYLHADVTDEAQIAALPRFARETFGRLDVMVNNAGASGDRSPIVDADAAGFDATTRLLLRAVLLGHKYAAQEFIAQGGGGSIISIGSIAGLEGGWGGVGYTASKHGVAGLVRAAAAQLGQHGIRSNAIHPGLVMTPVYIGNWHIESQHADEFLSELGDAFATQQPLGRVGAPADIANAALFLASDLSSWITGVQLPVDGGYMAVTNVKFTDIAKGVAARFSAETS